jgi:UMF1 family MFS transporter
LKLAKDAVGCPLEPPEGGDGDIPECTKKIYGIIRPSSLLSTGSTIVGLLLSCLLPLMGAIVDYTPHRLFIARLLVTIYCAVLFVGIFVSEQTWLPIALLQIIMAFTAWFETTLLYSYLPELSNDEDIQNEYTRTFAVLAFTSLVLYMGGIVGASAGLGYMEEDENNSMDDAIATARIAQSVSFSACTIGLGIAWGILFRKRPAAHQLPESQSVWTAGFRQVGRTVVKIYKHYPRLKWFYIAIAFCDSAISAVTILALTYLTDQLQFTVQENGMTMMAIIIAAIPGSFISSWITSACSAIVSSVGAVVLLIVNTAMVSIFLKGPGQQLETYILAAGWGLGTGWKYTCDKMVLLQVIPDGQNAELMGVFIFSRQVLAMLPPLVFTVLNEQGISQRIGIATLDIFFLLSLFAYIRLMKSEAMVGEEVHDIANEKQEEEKDSGEGGDLYRV